MRPSRNATGLSCLVAGSCVRGTSSKDLVRGGMRPEVAQDLFGPHGRRLDEDIIDYPGDHEEVGREEEEEDRHRRCEGRESGPRWRVVPAWV